MIKKFFYFLIIVFLLLGVTVAGVLYWFVVVEPGEEISEANIRGILGRESPVYYNDGVTPLGVFFADAHRQYVDYQEIPKDFVNALVAAEDNRFFSHFGFDIQGITRAAIKNIEAGRIVQGGSTLTQQTAKNLFKREDRSYKAKFKELIYALRLEYKYPKEQIFEFYSNQFYVSGNGLGLGVAARYYFDKTPNELTLIEAAYIAGSVKRPNYYNPFIKKNPEAVEQAKVQGRKRVAYVLKMMLDLGMISEYDYHLAKNSDVPFNKGNVGYALDYVMELVTEAVSSERVIEALSVHGIDNIATSGIRVITNVDKNIQQNTLHALRKQLSYLDVRLRGYERDEVQQELQNVDYRGDRTVDMGNFLFGTITEMSGQGDNLAIIVDLGFKDGIGRVDQSGLTDIVEARVKWKKNRWSESTQADYSELLEQLQEGDKVWVSVRELPDALPPLFDLERFPKVQGGAIVLKKGQIISVAGGVENRFFNRAVYGKRTMGSSYKPFVYGAAMQLGWNSADLLPNKRDVFVYQKQAYFPRPDHKIDNEVVSMSWAGVRSENLASVWLAAHLCDHLSSSQLEDVANYLGLTPKVVDGEPEPYRLFRSRIRDRYGIVIDEDILRKAAYRKTLNSIQADLIFEGLEQEYEAIRGLHYGLGFNQFKVDVDKELGQKGLSEQEKNELFLRRKILARNFLALQDLNNHFKFLVASDFNTQGLSTVSAPTKGRTPRLYYNPITEHYLYDYPKFVPEYAEPVQPWQLQRQFDQLDPFGKKEFVDTIKLGSTISVAAFQFVDRHVQLEYQKMRKLLPYSMDVLQEVEDYRILVGLHYLIAFGKFLGIESAMEPVLSFPLGSNVVTLLETTRVYEALVTGGVTLFTEENGEINNTLAIIDRIESEDGVVLFRPEKVVRRGVSAKTSLTIGHILENTVKFGTGREADRRVKMSGDELEDDKIDELGLSVPLFGKTGTANRYTNASFFGYLPTLNEDGNAMVIEDGYGIGVYVGFDDNKAMRKKTTRVTGSLGALPAWIDIANGIVRQAEFGSGLDPVDLSFYGLAIERKALGQKNLGVVKDLGGVLIKPLSQVDPLDRYQPSILTFGAEGENGSFKSARSFAPFWLNQLPPTQQKPGDLQPSSSEVQQN